MTEPPITTSGLTTILVVAADSGSVLGTCIDAALASAGHIEVLLVDNASTDGEVEKVEAKHGEDSRFRVLRNASNLGFGAACNRGTEHARGDALVFLNPDCFLEPATVSRLRAIMFADARIGLLGVTVCTPDRTPARANRRRDPTLRRALMTLSGLARLESRWRWFAGIEMPATVDTSGVVETVDAVSGACIAMPRNVFADLGGFDEHYFLHAEDLDLCRRVRDAGLLVAIVPELHILHEQGSSSRHRPFFVATHKHRSMWRYFNKFDPAARNPILRMVVASAIALHALAKSLGLVVRLTVAKIR